MTNPVQTSPPFDFSKLKERRAREREEARSTSARLAAEVRLTITPILQSHGVTRAYLFGSIAEGGAGARSDVDLLVLGVGAAAYWDLRHALELALGRPLDLFTQDDDPVFVAKVMTRGQVIYDPEP
jgi:predicted nucleotidyltransferase